MANEFKIKNGLVVSGSADFEQDLTVRGTLTADQLNISIVSSSVLFESGSTQLGNSITDTHKITGSLSITGSMTLNGQPIGTGKLDESTFQAYTGSTEPRITNLETSTGSINSFTNSINTTIKNKLNSDGVWSSSLQLPSGVVSGSSQILSGTTIHSGTFFNGITVVSSSAQVLNGTTIHSGAFFNGITVVSGSGQVTAFGFAITGSNNFVGNENINGNLNVTGAFVVSSGSAVYNSLLSLSDTSSLILNSGSNLYVYDTGIISGTFKGSVTGALSVNGNVTITGSILSTGTPLVSGSSQIDITNTTNYTTFSSSISSNIDTLRTATSSLNAYTSSNTTNINAIHTATSSLNSFTSSIDTTIKNKLNSDSVVSSSQQIVASLPSGTVSGSSQVLNGSGVWSGSAQLPSGIISSSAQVTNHGFAITGSNTFQGSQTITGSLYVSQDLIVAGSSSIQHISSSIVNIADNIITVNAQNPSIRFGGLAVIDSGSSPQVSGSILFDSINDQWIFVHQNQSTITSSVLLMGPQTFNNLGNESYPTVNKLIKSLNAEHLGDSNITDTGTKVSINSNTEITGTFVATGTDLVSGSSQINHNTTTNYVANEHINHTSVSISAGNGLSGGGDISTTRTLTLDTGSAHFTGGVKSKMNTDGVISGSAQVVAALPSGTVSGSSQVLNGSGVWSGSAQLPSGVVSGSSQVSFNGITDKPTLVSGSSQVSFNGITDKPALVSGSSQVSFSGLSGVPSGIVSGSSQVSFSGLSGVPSGLVSGSSQVLNGSGVWSGSAQLPSGVVSGSSQVSFSGLSGVPSGIVSGSSQISFGSISGVPSGLVSGSSQISFGSISGVPSGLVSGSSQIAIASTSGFGTYINQALLTTSTPTFSTVSATTFTGALSGNATTATTATTATNWGSYGAVPAAGTSFGNANTIGRSDGNGYTFFNYINSNTSNSENPTISQIIVTNGTDNYYRKASISHLTSAVQSNASGNWSINASNITSYTINQSVGTGNSPTFAGITSNGSTTTNGIGSFISSSDYQIILQGTDTWAGIQFDDSQSSPDYIWYNGSAQTFAIGGGGSNVSGKKLHVHGGMTVGSNYASTGTQTNGLTVEGNIVAASYLVVGGNYGNNAYNSVGSSRLMFGGGDGDAQSNYYIGTNLENVGGNYTKLDLRWHTGIRMGAQAGYGGIRFYDSEDLGTVLFSVGYTDGNVRSHTNLIPSANNSYNLGSSSLGWANVYTNDLHLSNMNKPEGNDIDGTNGNWTIQEGAENLYIINNNNGKKYKISLEEI